MSNEPKPLRVVVLSSQASNSGSNLRARSIASSLEKAGAEVRFINGVRALPFMLDYIVTAFLYLRVLCIPCDVIIGQKPYPNITIMMLIKKLFGAFIVVDIDDNDSGYRKGPIGRLIHLSQLPFPRLFDMVTYHTDALLPHITRVFRVKKERCYQLKQGVDLTKFVTRDVSRERGIFYETFNLRPGTPIVVYSAHLNIASDLDAILNIVKRARDMEPSLVFLVIGGGPLYNVFVDYALRKGMREYVFFTGQMAPEEAAACLQFGTAGIVYYKDNMVNRYRESMKLREMLALELKIVTNDVGDLKNFSAYTYQTKTDYDALAKELVALLLSGGDGREKNGREYIEREFDWKKLGGAFYREIVKRYALKKAKRSK